ncbi:MAG: hypothetical protein ONB12_11330 [candidate division KSB1 bacterium]|nr:hypothetical protein [candidate division KSB1 bacterium]
MNKRHKQLLLRVSGAALLILLAALFFARFDYRVKGPALLVPKAEWTIVQSEQDKLLTRLVQNDRGFVTTIELFHISRPDYVSLQIRPDLEQGKRLEANEVAAQLTSLEDQIRLSETLGLLEQANAQLQALKTGLKPTMQEEANQELQYAKVQLAAYEPILHRYQELFEKSLISRQQFDSVKAQYELYRIDVALKEARLRTAKTGEKAEMLAVIEAQIRSAATQMELLKKKASAESIRTPISGIVGLPDRLNGELFHLCSNDSLVVQMLIKPQDAPLVKPGQSVSVFIYGKGKIAAPARVLSISPNSRLVQVQPMYVALAVISNAGDLAPGMSGRYTLQTAKYSGWDLLRRSWKTYRFNK